MGNDVCLLLPHYNNPEGLIRSLKSISYDEEIDITIVDDGSTTKFNERKILKSFRAKGNINFLYLVENQGIVKALNHGLICILKNHQYKYISRLDCGDFCVGRRFQIQRNFLETNPEIFLLGSWARAIDLTGKSQFTLRSPSSHEEISKKMFFKK